MYDNSDDISTPDSGESARTPMGVLKVIWDTLAEFCEKTTIGGLCNAGLAPSKPRSLIWLIIFTVLVEFFRLTTLSVCTTNYLLNTYYNLFKLSVTY